MEPIVLAKLHRKNVLEFVMLVHVPARRQASAVEQWAALAMKLANAPMHTAAADTPATSQSERWRGRTPPLGAVSLLIRQSSAGLLRPRRGEAAIASARV